MAFPTTSVLYSATGSDDSPATGWVDSPDGATYGGIRRVSNQLASVSGDSWDYFDTSYGADQECYFLVPVLPGGSGVITVDFRLNPVGSTAVDGYEIEVRPDLSRIRVYLLENDGLTQIGTNIDQAFSAGDGIGVQAIGDTFEVFYSSGGGAYSSLGTRTDSTYNQAGYLGTYLADSTVRLGDFNGGTYVPPSGTNPRRRSLLGVGV